MLSLVILVGSRSSVGAKQHCYTVDAAGSKADGIKVDRPLTLVQCRVYGGIDVQYKFHLHMFSCGAAKLNRGTAYGFTTER